MNNNLNDFSEYNDNALEEAITSSDRSVIEKGLKLIEKLESRFDDTTRNIIAFELPNRERLTLCEAIQMEIIHRDNCLEEGNEWTGPLTKVVMGDIDELMMITITALNSLFGYKKELQNKLEKLN